MKDLQTYQDYLVNWIKSVVQNANAQGVVVGLSGGVDSAVAIRLAQLAFPDNHLAVFLPCDSDPLDQKCCEAIVKQHQIHYQSISLNEPFQALLKEINSKIPIHSQIAIANIKPRLRMTTLYSLAQEKNYLVMGTDNLDEWYTGYFTKYGDGAADLFPLSKLLKQDIYALSEILAVPEIIRKRRPTAGLWANQDDEQEMGFTYNDLDNFLMGNKVSNNSIVNIKKLHLRSQHKRNGVLVPDPFRKVDLWKNL